LRTVSGATGPEPAHDDAVAKLRQLAQLRDSGVISDSELDEKKQELLDRI
jgi:hypothetical protein